MCSAAGQNDVRYNANAEIGTYVVSLTVCSIYIQDTGLTASFVSLLRP